MILSSCSQPVAPPTSTLPASPSLAHPLSFTKSATSTTTLTATLPATTTPTSAQQVTQSPTAPASPVIDLSPLAGPGSASIIGENKKPGSPDWYVLPYSATEGDIAGFSDAVSVNVGETIRFAISTRKDGTLFMFSLYRLGWYGGSGGHLVLNAEGLRGQAQGYWTPSTIGVIDCPTCARDNNLGLLDTHWQYGYSLTIPTDWISGEYVAILTTAEGVKNIIYFVVRNDQQASDLLVQLPIYTEQAYNDWGGDSLYTHDSRLPPGINGGAAAVKVSFNRPYSRYSISADAQLIHFFERHGYDVTYATNADVDRDASILKNHKAFISVGHDEYWTRQMRLNIEQARDTGLNLAFLGGNDLYWQTRIEADSDGNAQRVMVMYRDATLDPLTNTDPSNVTVQFVQPPVDWPQNSLTGTIFGGIIEQPPGLPWIVAPSAPAWMLANTGLSSGDSVPALTGKECDSVTDNSHQPPGLVVVAASPLTTKHGIPVMCNTTYYKTSAGSAVFNAGTLSWPGSMDSFGHHNPGQSQDSRIIRLMMNVLASFGVQPSY